MPYNVDEMKKRFQKFGTIYTQEDIYDELDDIIGNEEKKEMMEDFFLSLKRFKEIANNLKKAKIIPNFTMLLYGPPGTGKTMLTRAMAKKYNIPIGIVEADRLVSPLLGDTLKNIRGVFELAVDFAKENGLFILFFDEIDSITSERANAHEVGEIKRAVISFLQIIDKISNDAIPLAIFGATNHETQLDSAVWRRFTYHLKFDFPNFIIRKKILDSFIQRIGDASIGIDNRLVKSLDDEFNFLMNLYQEKKQKIGHDLYEEDFDELYEKLKQAGKNGLLYFTQGYTGADLMRGMRVSLFKALQKNILNYDDYFHTLMMVGGTKSHVQQSEILTQTNKKDLKDSNKQNENDSSQNSKSVKTQKKKETHDKIDIDL